MALLKKIGSWAFILGALIAIIVGIYYAITEIEAGRAAFTGDTGGMIAWVLGILGVIVGALAAMGKGTITKNETQGFLIAGIALVVMGAIFSTGFVIKPYIGSLLTGISMALSIFVAPAVGILAIKSLWDLGKEE